MKLFLSDIKFIANRPLLLTALLMPFIFTLFLLYLFPFIFGLTRSVNAFYYDRYYTVTAITLISGIPFIYGLVFSFIHLKELNTVSGEGAEFELPDTKSFLISRMAFPSILSFVMVLPVIYLTDAVSTEGWLRSIYAALLLAVMSPFIFLFADCFGGNRKNWLFVSLISLIFLITVPSGLLLHHPWNYFAFFSPFYWVSWAWVIPSAAESMLYGLIALTITSSGMWICYRYMPG